MTVGDRRCRLDRPAQARNDGVAQPDCDADCHNERCGQRQPSRSDSNRDKLLLMEAEIEAFLRILLDDGVERDRRIAQA